MKKLISLLSASLALLSLPAAAGAQGAGEPAAPTAAIDYGLDANWLCIPGREDACGRPLGTAALIPSGYGPVEQVRPASRPAIDCFYVYPTVSRDPGMNSDMIPGSEEQSVAMVQLARFGTVCRTFAPIYRQATIGSIAATMAGTDPAPILDAAYRDVLSAWRQFLAHRNQGRPFVLIGHSQGTIHLIRLLASEIEGRPEARRMVSALLLGFNVEVPEGQLVGGSFRSTPLCTRVGQTGCVISYVSFRAEAPPPAGALFGRALRPGMTVACTNPAALGSAADVGLDSYWFAASPTSTISWSSTGAPPAPFLRTSGLAAGRCLNEGPLGYLAVTVNADPNDPRTDRIPGDVAIAGVPQPGWGLHLVDANIAMGDLLRVVQAQARSFRRPRR